MTAAAGKSFLDRMIALVEGALRQRTPNEIALSLVLSAFTLIFLIVTAALWPMALNAEMYMKDYLGVAEPVKSLGTDVPTLVALLVCLIPTTIGALLAAIGIAGMDRALRANIIAKSGKAVGLPATIRCWTRPARCRGQPKGYPVCARRFGGSILANGRAGIGRQTPRKGHRRLSQVAEQRASRLAGGAAARLRPWRAGIVHQPRPRRVEHRPARRRQIQER